MILYLIRHGIAEDAAPSGGDSERRLTQHGTLRTALVAKGLKQLGVAFDRIVSSPYVRALQTAEIVARVTTHKEEIAQDERLTPFASYEDACDIIGENNDVDSLLLVGHQPSMGRIASGITSNGQLLLDVKKASVTAIAIERVGRPAAGSLLWTVPPKVFERLVG